MKTIVLYSPELTGHPQVYCRVIGDILLEQGTKLIIATGDTADLGARWPDLAPFVDNNEVQIVSTRDFSVTQNDHLRAEELLNLQIVENVDTTLFIEPEHFRDEFIRIYRKEAKRLCGYNAGIFGRTTEWYPREEFYSGRKVGSFDGGFRSQLGRAKRRLFQPWTIDRYFFEKVLISGKVLDAVIVKDERLAERFSDKVFWLPEIFKVFEPKDTNAGDDEYALLKPRLDGFLSRHSPDKLVVFFGAGAWYKGYDYFIQLLADDMDAAGIHAGAGIRYERGKKFEGNPETAREDLLEQGRLFETKGYVESQRFIDEVFKAAQRFVSTHRLTVSSGTMLQALDYGLPVLVPDSGLVGHRARANGLGKTYRYGDSEDLLRQWKAFKEESPEKYRPCISKFMNRFKRDAVRDLVVKILVEQA